MSASGYPPRKSGYLGGALPAVLFITLLFWVNYTNRAVLGPLLVHMEKGLNLDHVQATSLFLFLSVGFSLGLLCSGFATATVAPRNVMVFSIVGSGIMMLGIANSQTLWEARTFFGLLGAVAGTYMPATMATLGSLVSPENWSRAIALHEMSPVVSFIVSPLLAETLAARSCWQNTMIVMGCLSVFVGFLFFLFGKGGREKTERPSAGGIAEVFRQPVFWAFTWLFGLAVGGEFTPYSLLPLSLTAEQGLNSTEASRLLSLSRIASPVAVLLGGWAVSRIGVARSLLLFLVVHGIALMAMAFPVSLVGRGGMFAAMTLQAIASAFSFPPLFALLAGAFPPGRQALLLSLSLPAAISAGTGLIPLFLGFCGEYTSFSLGYAIFGVLCLITLPVLPFCKNGAR